MSLSKRRLVQGWGLRFSGQRAERVVDGIFIVGHGCLVGS